MMRLSSACLALVVCLFAFYPATAQSVEPGAEVETQVHYWAQAGPAITTLGPGMAAQLSVEFDRHVLSLRGVSTEASLGNETWDVAFLYSRSTFFRDVFLSAGAGVSVVGGKQYSGFFGGDASDLDPMIGFPISAQAGWSPIPFVGIGAQAFFNVNTGHPFGGVGLVLKVGNLP